MHISYNILMSE